MSFTSLSPPWPLPFAFGCAGRSPSRSLPSGPRTYLLGCPAGISRALQGGFRVWGLGCAAKVTNKFLTIATCLKLRSRIHLRFHRVCRILAFACTEKAGDFGAYLQAWEHLWTQGLRVWVLSPPSRAKCGRGGGGGWGGGGGGHSRCCDSSLPSHAGKTVQTCYSVFLPLVCLESRRKPEYGREAGRHLVRKLGLNEGDIAPPEVTGRLQTDVHRV